MTETESLSIIEKIDSIPIKNYCYCGSPFSEHKYWEDRIYDYNGYRCPDTISGEYRFDNMLTTLKHKQARSNLLIAEIRELYGL